MWYINLIPYRQSNRQIIVHIIFFTIYVWADSSCLNCYTCPNNASTLAQLRSCACPNASTLARLRSEGRVREKYPHFLHTNPLPQDDKIKNAAINIIVENCRQGEKAGRGPPQDDPSSWAARTREHEMDSAPAVEGREGVDSLSFSSPHAPTRMARRQKASLPPQLCSFPKAIHVDVWYKLKPLVP